MLSVVLELVTGFVQYFTFIAEVDINFPSSWKEPMRYFSVVNLNFDFLRSWIPGLHDIRVYFIALSIAGPLFFVFFGLVFLNKKRVVLWYLLMVFAVMLVTAGVFGRVISATSSLDLSPDTAEALLYVGLVLMAAGALLFFVHRHMRCCHDESAAVVEKREVIATETRQVNVALLMERIMYLVLLAVGAMLLLGGFTAAVPNALDSFVGTERFSFGLGIAILVVFFFLLVWTGMGLSRAGRERQWAITNYLESGFLKILLITMSIAYIPIGSGCFLMFNCNDFTCPPGSRLPDRGSEIYFNSSNTVTDFCMPCQIPPGQRCPSSVALALCGGGSSERLEHEITTNCDGMRTFFWPAAFLIMIMYVLGVPLMFFTLIRASTVVIFKEFPTSTKEISSTEAERPPPDMDEDELWSKKVAQCRNCAKFLFSPFEFRYRYVRLFQLIQKLLIVGTSVYIIRNTPVSPQAISLGCSLAIHFIAACLLIRHKPFIAKFEDRIAVLMSCALTLACIVAILLLNGVAIPGWLMIVLIILNGVLPVMALVIGLMLEWSSSRKNEDEERKEKIQRLADELRREDERELERSDAQQAADAMNASAVEAGVLVPVPDSSPHYSPHSPAQPYRTPTTAERHEERALKREAVREAVRVKMQEELVELHERQETVDLRVDRLVKELLNCFLMVAGVLGFLALGCCILGLLVRDDSVVTGPFPDESTRATELVGYDSWDEFTANCCCAPGTNEPTAREFTVIEKWRCANGRMKERVRERVPNAASSPVSGLAIRDVCATDFRAGCTLMVAPDSRVAVECDSSIDVSMAELTLW